MINKCLKYGRWIFTILFRMWINDIPPSFCNNVLFARSVKASCVYMQIEPSENGTDTNESMMINRFIYRDSSDEQSVFSELQKTFFLYWITAIIRSNHRRCSVKNGVLKYFANFTGKNLCWSLFLLKLKATFKRKICGNCAFLQNYHIRKLCETLVFGAV